MQIKMTTSKQLYCNNDVFFTTSVKLDAKKMRTSIQLLE